jgi:hypothetical protein
MYAYLGYSYFLNWSVMQDLNLRPVGSRAPKPSALPNRFKFGR